MVDTPALVTDSFELELVHEQLNKATFAWDPERADWERLSRTGMHGPGVVNWDSLMGGGHGTSDLTARSRNGPGRRDSVRKRTMAGQASSSGAESSGASVCPARST